MHLIPTKRHFWCGILINFPEPLREFATANQTPFNSNFVASGNETIQFCNSFSGMLWPCWNRESNKLKLAMRNNFFVLFFIPMNFMRHPNRLSWQISERVPDVLPDTTLKRFWLIILNCVNNRDDLFFKNIERMSDKRWKRDKSHGNATWTFLLCWPGALCVLMDVWCSFSMLSCVGLV